MNCVKKTLSIAICYVQLQCNRITR